MKLVEYTEWINSLIPGPRSVSIFKLCSGNTISCTDGCSNKGNTTDTMLTFVAVHSKQAHSVELSGPSSHYTLKQR